MKAQIKFFGMFIEQNGSSIGELPFENNSLSYPDFKQLLLNKYPFLQNSTFVVAVNQSIANQSTNININDEIAILPPFAGG